MIDIKGYIEEVKNYENNISLYDKLLELKESYLDTNHLNKTEHEIYLLSINILEELFNPLQLYNEPIIPLSFLQSNIGKTLLGIINDNNNRVLTIYDMVKMSKTKNNEKGYSYQYINKEIKVGRLKATKYNGSWQIEYEEAIKFLERKNIL